MHAWRRKPVGEDKKVAATHSSVVWLWFCRPTSTIEWFKTLIASAVKDFEQQYAQRMRKQQQKQLLQSLCFLEACVCENYQQGRTPRTQR
ncbi:hypothetical protein D8674_017729 [Pyrus ussuriensis x Pyrus communis]|uniref:Uncharacterized protein n=1 Tax=Pyrus ussuriensis x Pyrus communis TaxID=2448454 RepID=A0A5N5HDK2_9ROSA|nr:hypothetical protein D8674_017729 [Pyrus ussuriensis x Pyrus communis]